VDVFVSYASADKAVADAAVASLERARMRCWYAPRDITPGANYGDSIMAALVASRVLVVIVSASSVASNQVVREVERAVHHGLVVVPFRVENVEMRGSFEFFLSVPHWLDALTPPLEAHLDRLTDSVRAILNSPRLGGPAPESPRAAAIATKDKPEEFPEIVPDQWSRRPGGRVRRFLDRFLDDPEGS
jgi:hypothetical protein